MATISVNQVFDILKSIEQYMEDKKKVNSAIEVLLWQPTDVTAWLGGNLVDSLLEILEAQFSDDIELFEWYIFVNDFGKNHLTKLIDEKETEVNSVFDILEILEKRNMKTPVKSPMSKNNEIVR